MKVKIGKGDILPEGVYELTSREKLENAKSNLPFSSIDRQILIEYDRIGGRVVKDRFVLPHQSLWNLEMQNQSRPIEQFSDIELLAVIRRAENTDVAGSLYQKANSEWQIRQQQKILKATQNIGDYSSNESTKIIQGNVVHGDYIAGDKVGRDKNIDSSQNVTIPSKDASFWRENWGNVITVIMAVLPFLGAGAYTYFNPNRQPAQVVSSANTIPNGNKFSTTTPNLADIFLKINPMLDLEKENFLKDFKNGPVYAVGAAFDNINSSGDSFIVSMTVERNSIGCKFSSDFKTKLLLLKKDDKVDFYGTFTGSGLWGYGDVNPWYITGCVLLK